MRMRKKPNLEPRMDRCAHLIVSDPNAMRGRWLNDFGFNDLQLEIGCGKGRFIVETAKCEPDTLFIALEKTANVLVAALELTVREDVQNIRFINALAENISGYFAPGELTRIYLNFSDPWPSNRHRKRRLVSGNFLSIYSILLCPKGELHFKTDNKPLFDFALTEIIESDFSLTEKSDNLHKDGYCGIMTEYEQKFVDRGIPIYWCRAALQERS